MIYFDNAASSFPKPQSVVYGLDKWIRHNGANPGRSGHKPAIDAAEAVFETRVAVADMFGVEDCERVAFVPNASYGLNILIQGLLNDGDHVITTVFEHNSVLRPLFYMQKTKKISIDVCDVDLYNDNITVENILGKIRNNTKLVICTQCSNVCGKVMPIRAISKNLPENVKLLVDGSQGAGIIPINLSECGVDYYCAPSHKGLLGIQGTGFIVVNSDLPKPFLSGGTGSESMNLYQPDYMPDIYEIGTLPTPAIISIKYGIDFISSYGLKKIYDEKVMLTRYAYSRLKEINGVKTYVDTTKSDFVGIVFFNVNTRKSDEVASYLAKNNICVRSGIHCAPFTHKKFGTENTGAVRISFSLFNTRNQVDTMIKILNNYTKN